MTEKGTDSKAGLTPDNRIVHGMWIGTKLSKLELLTVHSFLHHGHEFHLWAYDDIETPLPHDIVLRDATEIFPRSAIFSQRAHDSETGVGRGSYALFADLFRYKLLYEFGGYWVDMDVTCLRPFDFDTDYVFRPHRVGVVGNVMKCPPHSELMRQTLEMASEHAGEDMEWLLSNRILSENVKRLHLTQYIYRHMSNPESWIQAIRPLVESRRQVPAHWYAIHWINEFWNTVGSDEGYYKGQRLFEKAPDKNHPPEESTLADLYRTYGLPEEPAQPVDVPLPAAPPPLQKQAVYQVLSPANPPLNTPSARQPPFLNFRTTRHINILLPSMTLGGAERSVQDLLISYGEQATTVNLFLLYDAKTEYPLPKGDWLQIHRLTHQNPIAKLQTVALEVFSSPCPVVYTHMVSAMQLRKLWELGVTTIPVIQNSQPSWQDPPTAFNHVKVPFVVAVSEAVADQLRAAGCKKPVVVIRHQIQRWFTPKEIQENRKAIRRQYGVSDSTLLIGMVGQFKAQKAYPRAIRILQQVQKFHPAKLIILGGWDHDYGDGRATHIDTCRLALELDVMTDVILPGAIHPVEPYFAAIDIFLNTSSYEGLSVAMLEAIQCGCSIVTADAGGNRESLPANAALIEAPEDIEAYVEAIWTLLNRKERTVAQKSPDSDLVPALWRLLATYGRQSPQERNSHGDGVLFLTTNLNLGGPQRSLVNLLRHLLPGYQAMLCVLDTVYCREYLEELESARIPIFSLQYAARPHERVERILHLLDNIDVRNICFWNADARVKLLLAKVLQRRAIRLIDVSPGPMVFDDMQKVLAYQQAVCMTAEQYLQRLDYFVSKYTEGGLSLPSGPGPKLITIPNGVPSLSASAPATELPEILPGNCSPDLHIGTCCRIAPAKRIEFLIDMMALLTERLPGASLTIVGGVDPRHVPYWQTVVQKLKLSGLKNVFFVGGHADVRPFLQRFRVFVMISEDQGCPNASLEAMAMGLPVVANPSGGTAEQIEQGINGFLVSGQDPAEMAERLEYLLTHSEIRQQFGEAGARIAQEKFSMKAMADRYLQLFCQQDEENGLGTNH